MRYRIEWAGGSCYLHADTEAEATEQARDLAEDLGREVAVLAQDGDGWRCVGMVAAERKRAGQARGGKTGGRGRNSSPEEIPESYPDEEEDADTNEARTQAAERLVREERERLAALGL
jgi:hypothetical protein